MCVYLHPGDLSIDHSKPLPGSWSGVPKYEIKNDTIKNKLEYIAGKIILEYSISVIGSQPVVLFSLLVLVL